MGHPAGVCSRVAVGQENSDSCQNKKTARCAKNAQAKTSDIRYYYRLLPPSPPFSFWGLTSQMTRSVHRPIYSSVSTLAQEIQHHHILPAMRPLSVLLAMPGRKIVFSVLPLALGGGAVGVWALQGGSHCTTTAKADAVVSSALSDGGKGNGSTQPAAAVVQAGSSPTLPNLLAKLGLGGNEFANVSIPAHRHTPAAAGCQGSLAHAWVTQPLQNWHCLVIVGCPV